MQKILKHECHLSAYVKNDNSFNRYLKVFRARFSEFLSAITLRDSGSNRACTVDHGAEPRVWSFDRNQCITIPAWDKVNARNAPTANRGTSLSVTPLKKISRPHTANTKGRNPSCDTVRQTRGKSAKEVFADRQSTRRIAAIVT